MTHLASEFFFFFSMSQSSYIPFWFNHLELFLRDLGSQVAFAASKRRSSFRSVSQCAVRTRG